MKFFPHIVEIVRSLNASLGFEPGVLGFLPLWVSNAMTIRPLILDWFIALLNALIFSGTRNIGSSMAV
uniref:Uncharacterized protein n=1 Tax=Romanomermis culicivorax TaxID=13658 RepID=A0A915KS49_ROMCU